MCMFKSMLLLKDKVFCPNYDSHEDMINETGMEHGPMRENFVRVEITPPDDDLTVPIDKWKYKVDQDYLPEWYVEEVDKPRCFDALKAWAVKHILVGQDVPEVKQGEFVVLVNCNTGIVKGTVQKVWGGTVQEVHGGGTVQKVWGGTVQKVWGGGTVQKVWDGGTVQEVRGGTVQKVRGGGTVQEVWDGGTVQEVRGGTVQEVWDGTVQKQTGGIVIYADGCISVCNKNFYRLITPEEMK
ncbi:MAG: hypothetical protein ACLRWF_05855 [Ruthenibacterium sp.]